MRVLPARPGADLLGLPRKLGLVGNASVMGAVVAFATAANEVAMARPAAQDAVMRVTLAVAATRALPAIAMSASARTVSARVAPAAR